MACCDPSDLQPPLDRVRSASTNCLRPDSNSNSPDRERYSQDPILCPYVLLLTDYFCFPLQVVDNRLCGAAQLNIFRIYTNSCYFSVLKCCKYEMSVYCIKVVVYCVDCVVFGSIRADVSVPWVVVYHLMLNIPSPRLCPDLPCVFTFSPPISWGVLDIHFLGARSLSPASDPPAPGS